MTVPVAVLIKLGRGEDVSDCQVTGEGGEGGRGWGGGGGETLHQFVRRD